MANISKEKIKQHAESAKTKAKAKLNSIYANVQTVEGRPNIEHDETLLLRAYEGKATAYLIGFIACFIPPFVFGPIILLITYYISSKSGVMVTNRRVVAFRKTFKPNMYRVREFPIKHISEVSRLPATHSNESFLDRLFGAGSLKITWESTTDGTSTGIIPVIRKPKNVERVIKDAMTGAKAQ